MHSATCVMTWHVAGLYSVHYAVQWNSLSQKPFRIGNMNIYTFLLRMTNIMTSQNTDLFSSWDTLYMQCKLITFT
jgi:hypothetical protein